MAAKKKTTAKRKTNATKKAKDKQMMQTHAMEEKESFEKTTLDQIWGDDGTSKSKIDAAKDRICTNPHH